MNGMSPRQTPVYIQLLLVNKYLCILVSDWWAVEINRQETELRRGVPLYNTILAMSTSDCWTVGSPIF